MSRIVIFLLVLMLPLAATAETLYESAFGPISREALLVSPEADLTSSTVRTAIDTAAHALVLEMDLAKQFDEQGLSLSKHRTNTLDAERKRGIASAYLDDRVYSKAALTEEEKAEIRKEYGEELSERGADFERDFMEEVEKRRAAALLKQFEAGFPPHHGVPFEKLMMADRLDAIVEVAVEEGYAERSEIVAAIEASRRRAVAIEMRRQKNAAFEDEFSTPTLSAQRDFFDAHPEHFHAPETRDIFEVITQRGADAAEEIAEGFRGASTMAERNSFAHALKDQEEGVVRRLFTDRHAGNFSGYGKAALELEEGGVLDPIPTKDGISIFVVLKTKPAWSVEFDVAQDRVVTLMRDEYAAQRVAEWEADAMENANLRWVVPRDNGKKIEGTP